MDAAVSAGGGKPKAPGVAIASLVLGILALPLTCLTGIPAVICGHIAVSKIGKSAGALGGKGMAITGLVLGYLGIVLSVAVLPAIMAVPVFSGIQDRGQEVMLTNNARQVYMACKIYAADNDGVWPQNLQQLVDEQILDGTEILEAPEFMGPEMSGQAMFQLLVPGQNDADFDPGREVIISVVPVGKLEKWIVVFADGSAHAVPRAELDAALAPALGPESGTAE